ncbi:unnamed protein product [Didymodactylos carnosus]|uniref:Uncharacterized protein n=1 Tax=Didymodactylos carnosus TaxID=1234261 RepID=A0A815A3L7_9BILA|nr:unnamed protein product [Didymodactylos carnosus]CAF4019657.1 unnamed protein product [Didymodactylos carnosus]
MATGMILDRADQYLTERITDGAGGKEFQDQKISRHQQFCNRCNRYILRAIFAYHYEHNCHNPNEEQENQEPPSSTRFRTIIADEDDNQKFETTFHDDMYNDDQNRFQRSHSSMHHRGDHNPIRDTVFRTDSSGKILGITSLSNKREQRNNGGRNGNTDNDENIVSCEYCNQLCALTDFDHHKKYCLRNPSAKANNRTRTHEAQTARTVENDIELPCEYCNKLVNIEDFQEHMTQCTNLDRNRIQNHRRKIESDSVIGKIPCEHCNTLCDFDELNIHEMDCVKSPRNIAYAAQKEKRSTIRDLNTSNMHKPTATANRNNNKSDTILDPSSLYTRPRKNTKGQIQSTPDRTDTNKKRSQSAEENRAQYTSIDIDRTKEANSNIPITTTTRRVDSYGFGLDRSGPRSRENLFKKSFDDDNNYLQPSARPYDNMPSSLINRQGILLNNHANTKRSAKIPSPTTDFLTPVRSKDDRSKFTLSRTSNDRIPIRADPGKTFSDLKDSSSLRSYHKQFEI